MGERAGNESEDDNNVSPPHVLNTSECAASKWDLVVSMFPCGKMIRCRDWGVYACMPF